MKLKKMMKQKQWTYNNETIMFCTNPDLPLQTLFESLFQMWTDYGLSWDPKKYSGIEVIRLPHDLVWKPDIFLYNKYALHQR